MEVQEQLNKKLALRAFFESDGYKQFAEDLANLVEGTDAQVDNEELNPVEVARLGQLNFVLGKKAGLAMVLGVLDSYREELEG